MQAICAWPNLRATGALTIRPSPNDFTQPRKQPCQRIDARFSQGKHPAIDGHNPAAAKVIPAQFSDRLRKRKHGRAIPACRLHVPEEHPRKRPWRGFERRQRRQACFADRLRTTPSRTRGGDHLSTDQRTRPTAAGGDKPPMRAEPRRSCATGSRNQAAAIQHGPRHPVCCPSTWSARSSVHLGNPGKCIVREMVWMVIDPAQFAPPRCPMSTVGSLHGALASTSDPHDRTDPRGAGGA